MPSKFCFVLPFFSFFFLELAHKPFFDRSSLSVTIYRYLGTSRFTRAFATMQREFCASLCSLTVFWGAQQSIVPALFVRFLRLYGIVVMRLARLVLMKRLSRWYFFVNMSFPVQIVILFHYSDNNHVNDKKKINERERERKNYLLHNLR